jgi:hypothetical protein
MTPTRSAKSTVKMDLCAMMYEYVGRVASKKRVRRGVQMLEGKFPKEASIGLSRIPVEVVRLNHPAVYLNGFYFSLSLTSLSNSNDVSQASTLSLQA